MCSLQCGHNEAEKTYRTISSWRSVDYDRFGWFDQRFSEEDFSQLESLKKKKKKKLSSVIVSGRKEVFVMKDCDCLVLLASDQKILDCGLLGTLPSFLSVSLTVCVCVCVCACVCARARVCVCLCQGL